MNNPRWVWAHGKRIEIETLDYPARGKARRSAKRKPKFNIAWVKLPNYWIEQLEQCRHGVTFKLAHRILRAAFQQQYRGGDIVLSAAATGLSRSSRRRAVAELEVLGLIRTERVMFPILYFLAMVV